MSEHDDLREMIAQHLDASETPGIFSLSWDDCLAVATELAPLILEYYKPRFKNPEET